MHNTGGSCPSSDHGRASSLRASSLPKRPRVDAATLSQHPCGAAASTVSIAHAPLNECGVVVSAGAEVGAELESARTAEPGQAQLGMLAGLPEASAEGNSKPQLLLLAESHARLTNELLQTLRLASESMLTEHGDLAVAAYHDGIRAVVAPLTEASKLLQQVVLYSKEI